MTRRERILAALAAVATVLVGVLVNAPAGAHTEVRESSPGPGAVVGGEVTEIQLAFWSRIQPTGTNQISLAGPDGAPVATDGQVRLAAVVMAQRFEPLTAPGTYKVSYVVTAEDGAAVEGEYSFDFDPDAAAPAPVVGADTLPESENGGAPIGAALAFGAMAAFAGVVLWLAFGRKSSAAKPAKGGANARSAAARVEPGRPGKGTQSQRRR